jgi:hypothetical protein
MAVVGDPYKRIIAAFKGKNFDSKIAQKTSFGAILAF